MTAEPTEEENKIVIRPANDRGQSDRDWLESYHTFAFGQYMDRDWTRWGPLRVLNEDYVAPDSGFPMHRHENMEIVTYPLSGTIAHEDDSGGSGTIRPGQVQRMTAGTGIKHSEWNPSDNEPLHLLQIWFLPERDGLDPSYETVTLPEPDTVQNQLDLIGSPDAADGGVRIEQDVRLYRSHLDPDVELQHEIEPDRSGWIQIISGTVQLNGHTLSDGDGAGIRSATSVSIQAEESAHFLFFNMTDVS